MVVPRTKFLVRVFENSAPINCIAAACCSYLTSRWMALNFWLSGKLGLYFFVEIRCHRQPTSIAPLERAYISAAIRSTDIVGVEPSNHPTSTG